MPDIPTFAEAGLPGFGGSNWVGLAAPAATPKETTTRLYAEVRKALETKDMQDFIASLSAQPGGLDPEAFARLIKDETARWAKVAEKANIERQHAALAFSHPPEPLFPRNRVAIPRRKP